MNIESNVVSVYRETEDLITIKTGDGRTYDLVHDDWTGDWLVSSDDDPMIQGDWMKDKESAVQYALHTIGVIEGAPDRAK